MKFLFVSLKKQVRKQNPASIELKKMMTKHTFNLILICDLVANDANDFFF